MRSFINILLASNNSKEMEDINKNEMPGHLAYLERDPELMTGPFVNNMCGVSYADSGYAPFDNTIKGLMTDVEPEITMESTTDKLGCECYYFRSSNMYVTENLSRNLITPQRFTLCKVFKLNNMNLIQIGKSIMPLDKFLDTVEVKSDTTGEFVNCITKDKVTMTIDIHFDYIITVLIQLTNIYRKPSELAKVAEEIEEVAQVAEAVVADVAQVAQVAEATERVTMLGQVKKLLKY